MADWITTELRLSDDVSVNLRVPDHIAHISVRELANRDVLNGTAFSIQHLFVPFVTQPSVLPLFPFQVRGVEFLKSATKRILADDMGLGKSLQAIAAVGDLIRAGEIGPVLIVCPKTLVFNWQGELNRWDPDLAVNVLLPKRSAAREIWAARFGKCHVTITSYDHLRESADYIPKQMDLVVADEAHRLRNLGSQVSRAFANLNSHRMWFLSGTPVERDAEDLASLLSIVEPTRFSASHARLQPAVLRNMASKYVLRRSKSDVLADLPEHVEIVEKIPMLAPQIAAYREAQSLANVNYLEKFSMLRAICDYEPQSGTSAKLERVVEILSDIRAAGEKAVVFSFWVEPLDELLRRLKVLSWGEIRQVRAEYDPIRRAREIEAFKGEGSILLASGRIGAEGLTLTEANHVLFINRWWNPSANAQAVDRVRRIGQKRQTFSYFFVAAGTIEERVSALLQDKVMTFDALVEQLREEGEL
jgi:SNF2 family DNA or RNA helicase